MDTPVEESGELDIATIYFKQLQNHIENTSAHLRGTIPGQDPLTASTVPPFGFWTPAEKDAFFHGLCVYSRLRPDLIAEDIKTKSIADVCAYLEQLQQAVEGTQSQVTLETCDIAMDMSENWVAIEDSHATFMSCSEPIWDASRISEKREELIERERLRFQPNLGAEIRDSKDRAKRANRLRSKYSKQLRSDLKLSWEREDLLDHLGVVHFKVIDNIFREDEEKHVNSVPDLSAPATPSHVPSPTMDATALAPSIPNPVIDPSLLALTTEGFTLSQIPQTPIRQPTAVQEPTLLHSSNATLTSTLPVEEQDLSNMTPKSRRRLQKRLYMRRKRAEQTGGVVSAQVARLKPGPKCKPSKKARSPSPFISPRRKSSARTGASSPHVFANLSRQLSGDTRHDTHESTEDLHASLRGSLPPSSAPVPEPVNEADEGSEHFSPHKNSGRTARYKAKSQLTRLGLDVDALRKEGLGLLHLGALGNFMEFHRSLTTVPSNVNSEIATKTLEWLTEQLIAFVMELMHQSIALAEMEGSLKKHTKVWRARSHAVTAATVHKTIQNMRVFKNMEELFSKFDRTMQFVHECGLEGENAQVMEADDRPSASEEDSGSEEVSPEDPRQEPMDIQPSLFWYPCLDYNTGDQFDQSGIASEGSVVGDIDEEALRAELFADEELNQRDLQLAEAYEEDLWGKFKPQKHGHSAKPNRKTAGEHIKSNVFVEDSD